MVLGLVLGFNNPRLSESRVVGLSSAAFLVDYSTVSIVPSFRVHYFSKSGCKRTD